MRRLRRSAVEAAAEMRADGYLPDILAVAKPDGDFIELSEEDFQRLKAKYRAPQCAQSWPLAFRLISHLKTKADIGVGDTIARVFGAVGGEAFKTWFKRITGKSCGCTERQEDLNLTYPY